MPPKIRGLIRELEKAGFKDGGVEAATGIYSTLRLMKPITIAGKSGDDALHYRVLAVRKAIEELRK